MLKMVLGLSLAEVLFLDVYKRQELMNSNMVSDSKSDSIWDFRQSFFVKPDSSITCGVIQADENGMVMVGGVMKNIWEMPLHEIAHDLGPVSYTHLDVYKRQSDNRCQRSTWQ